MSKEKKSTTKKPKYYEVENTNRMRLYLEENGTLEGCSFKGVRIEKYDIRTKSFKGVRVQDSVFEKVNMQGSDFSQVDKCEGNTFVNCVFEYGVEIDSLRDKNDFINCKF